MKKNAPELRNEQSERIFNRRAGPVAFGACVGLALLVHLALQMAPGAEPPEGFGSGGGLDLAWGVGFGF